MERHQPFQPYLIWSAILLGLFGGFGLGGHLVHFLAFGIAPGQEFSALVQVHGHLQLLGWTGFFIIGVSLYKLPRLFSSRPLSKTTHRLIYRTLISGLLLKSSAQILLFYCDYESALRAVVALGSGLESLGITCYFFALFKSLVAFSAKPAASAAASIKPFLIVSFFGWLVYAIINAFIGLVFLFETSTILSPGWNAIATETYIHLVLLPTCFAFSISTFPIFLRLRAPNWPVARAAILYLLGAISYLLSITPMVLSIADLPHSLRAIGICLRTTAIFWIVWELDLIRHHRPWFRKFRDNQDRVNHPPRRHAGDYGQFGNFEWLIYLSYIWLVIAAASEFAGLWFNSVVSFTIIRHFYLLGFVTHLILGMAVRIIPGFLGKNRIAYPSLVRLSLLLILLSTTSRTLPLVFSALNYQPLRLAYGLSGIMAILAVTCLGINLLATVKQSKRPLAH